MARKGPKQRTLLLPELEAPAGLTQRFDASHRLSRALSMERKTTAGGQTAYLQQKAKQASFVEEARRRPKPPLESVVAHQGLLSDLRRDAIDRCPAHLRGDRHETDECPLPSAEKPPMREQRQARQSKFLETRKTRHEEACASFEEQMDALAVQCQGRTQEASEQMKESVDNAVGQANGLLHPLEEDTECLGERSEDEVRGVLSSLEGVTELRRGLITHFTAELEAVDHSRRERSTAFLKKLAEELHGAAHDVPGNIERVIEEKSMDLNHVLLENQKAVKMLTAKLLTKTLEDSKANKVRWRKGLLLWREKRHKHTVKQTMERIQGEEFQQPPALVEILAHVRDQQQRAFDSRKALASTFFSTSLPDVQPSAVRTWEEQNTSQNDRAQDAFDGLLDEIKTFRDGLDTTAETMMSNLFQELEIHDARSAWGEHESVGDLINADIRPHLKQALDSVRGLIASATSSLSRQEEAQHLTMTQLLGFFSVVAKKKSTLDKELARTQSDYDGEVETCEENFVEEIAGNEQEMNRFKTQIEAASHHKDLEDLRQRAFDHLDEMEQGFRDHEADMLSIYNKYPELVSTFVREQTAGFCEELGLVLQPEPPKPALDGDDPALLEKQQAEEQAYKDRVAELEGLPEWDGNCGVRVQVLEQMTLSQLRERVNPPAGSAEGDEADGGADSGAAAGEEAAPTEPLLLNDGTPVLEELSFSEEWLEDNLGFARTTIFKELAAKQELLLQVDIKGECEKIRRETDQSLNKHGTRKGEVQVDWYEPRHSTIAKHKDKFERHLVDVARKSQGHDLEVEQLHAEIETAEKAYKDQLEELTAKLADAENLSKLNAYERQAEDLRQGFQDGCETKMSVLMNLAEKAPKDLQKANKGFLASCSSGEEQYSHPELLFYSGEVSELDSQLTRKKTERMERKKELEQQLDEKMQGPYLAFKKTLDEVEENLCASKGYGKKYGKPRRKAQGLRKTLSTEWIKAKENIQELINYLVLLCNLPADREIIEGALPPAPRFHAGDKTALMDKLEEDGGVEQFRKRIENKEFSGGDYGGQIPQGDPHLADDQVAVARQRPSMFHEFWQSPEDQSRPFSAEIIGALYIAVCALCHLGTHLSAFKVEPEDRSKLYRPTEVPLIRLHQEAEVLCEGADEDEKKAKEAMEVTLRQGCLEQVMGAMLSRKTFDEEIQKIGLEAEKESKEVFSGGLPDFMQKFLAEMKESTHEDRLNAACDLRGWSDLLRDTQLLPLGDVLFGELAARALAELRGHTERVKVDSTPMWADCDKKRADHETRLNPRLSNPNCETELQELIDEEEARAGMARQIADEDRKNMADCLRGLADSFVKRLAATFESTVLIVDRLPLHTHFAPLPGDDQIENPRLSIKRRMRNMNNDTNPDQWGDGLPARKWIGVPRYELRGALRQGSWPADEELAEVAEEALQKEQTKEVASVRSPLHKRLFERRTLYYERYRGEFLAEVKRRDEELTARSEKELAGQRTWQNMVRQLRGGDAGGPGAGET